MYGSNFTIAPLSVLVDPIRARRVFGLEKGPGFSDKVAYIYHKQIEEADLVVISKTDLLDGPQLAELREAIAARYPRVETISVSVRQGLGLDSWFARILETEQSSRATMDVDYDTYADGEARLGWLNCTIRIEASRPFDVNRFLECVARGIQGELQKQEAEIAHLKMTVSPDDGLGEIAAANLVRNDFVPELSLHLDAPIRGGQLILNLRAEADAESLAAVVQRSLTAAAADFSGMRTTFEHLEHFQPGRPQPTHRDLVPAN
jgi:G3E family GTPase